VQSTHVGTLPTRIVIPLRPTLDLGFSGKPSDLLPVFEIAGKSAIPLNALGSRISSLADHRDAILAALDRIFSAY
jgi:toxin CcdB